MGTRGSRLAIAQSRLIAAALTERHPGLAIELVAVETRGDRDRRTALDTVNDPDFFNAELDAALLCGDVDFCVHSLKDLGGNRPTGIVRAAIPRREDPRDVIVYRPGIVERLRQGRPIRIGSSSRRRQRNVADFLREGLPRFSTRPQLKFTALRGPVDQRLARIHIDTDDDDALDGVVLALAGLARLWRDPDGYAAIEPQLGHVRWMVLPLSACPAAAGQGALAIECRDADRQTRALLASLHDEPVAELVGREFTALEQAPRKLRDTIGATALAHSMLGSLLFVRGHGVEQIIWTAPATPAHAHPWDGAALQLAEGRRSLAADATIGAHEPVFAAHWRAVPEPHALHPDARIWVSGIASWRQLADRGIWVEGCADNLGFAALTATLQCPVLRLPTFDAWTALTHARATESWTDSGIGRVIATYELIDRTANPDRSQLYAAVETATHFFWGSVEQYRTVESWLPRNAQHACGAGKTAIALRAHGITSLQVFPSRREWQAWLS